LAKEVCIWNRQSETFKGFNLPEQSATYEQMISAGWVPTHEGDITVVFTK